MSPDIILGVALMIVAGLCIGVVLSILVPSSDLGLKKKFRKVVEYLKEGIR